MTSNTNPSNSPSFYLPHETSPQKGTIMSWPTESSVVHETGTYPPGDIHATRSEVADIARAIAKFQPLHLFVRHSEGREGRAYGVQDTNLSSARALLGGVENVTVHVTENVYSLWARDTGPTFVRGCSGEEKGVIVVENVWEEGDDPGVGFQGKSSRGETVALLLNYNFWGRKCVPNPDMYFAAAAAETLNVPAYSAPFIAEGGAIESDGDGTLLATESSLLNPNRNSGVQKLELEGYFRRILGVEKVLWIPGKRGEDITDDHVDSLARFARPGVVFVGKPFVPHDVCCDGEAEEDLLRNWRDIREILGKNTDAKGRRIEVIDVPEPDPSLVLGGEYFPEVGPSVAYVNFVVVNGGVVMSGFGDVEADREAKRIIEGQFPGRRVVQVRVHHLGAQGGGIHCATQQILA